MKEKKEINEENCLLLVSGSRGDKEEDKKYVKKLSNAILQVYYKYGLSKLRCVGAASVNIAIKAFIIAKGEAQKRGDNLIIDPSFTTVSFEKEDKTGIIMDVKSLLP